MIQTGLQKLVMSLGAKYDLSGPSAMQCTLTGIALSLMGMLDWFYTIHNDIRSLISNPKVTLLLLCLGFKFYLDFLK